MQGKKAVCEVQLYHHVADNVCVRVVSPGAQLSFICIVYPSVLITYLGQAAFLWQNPESFANTFYDAIPEPVYWPMFVISILAAIVASQVLPMSVCPSSRDTAFTAKAQCFITIRAGRKRGSCDLR